MSQAKGQHVNSGIRVDSIASHDFLSDEPFLSDSGDIVLFFTQPDLHSAITCSEYNCDERDTLWQSTYRVSWLDAALGKHFRIYFNADTAGVVAYNSITKSIRKIGLSHLVPLRARTYRNGNDYYFLAIDTGVVSENDWYKIEEIHMMRYNWLSQSIHKTFTFTNPRITNQRGSINTISWVHSISFADSTFKIYYNNYVYTLAWMTGKKLKTDFYEKGNAKELVRLSKPHIYFQSFFYPRFMVRVQYFQDSVVKDSLLNDIDLTGILNSAHSGALLSNGNLVLLGADFRDFITNTEPLCLAAFNADDKLYWKRCFTSKPYRKGVKLTIDSNDVAYLLYEEYDTEMNMNQRKGKLIIHKVDLKQGFQLEAAPTQKTLVYPNPVISDYFFVRAISGIKSFVIQNSSGVTVMRGIPETIGVNEFEINLPSLSAGVHHLRLIYAGNKEIYAPTKFVKF